jgi:hypothetical protein
MSKKRKRKKRKGFCTVLSISMEIIAQANHAPKRLKQLHIKKQLVHIQIDHGHAQLAAGPAALDFSKRSLDLLFSSVSSQEFMAAKQSGSSSSTCHRDSTGAVPEQVG